MSKNIAIYARVSTDWQAEKGYSIQTQIDACRTRAYEIGAKTIKEYVDDGYSGAYLERPALDELRQVLKEKVYDVIICYDPDRLSRNLSHQLIITDDIDRSGAELIFVSVKFEQSPEGRLFYAVRGAISDYEREKIRERTMRGKRGKLQSGKVITDSHVYGYDFDKENSQYVINPYEANVIRKIFDYYLIDRIGGAEMIAIQLSKEDIPSPFGNSVWSSTTIRAILRREMYTGTYYAQTYYHKKIGTKKEVRIPRDKSEWILMTAPAIISKEQFKEACDLMDKKRTYKTWQRSTNIYLLQGLLRCGVCGQKMSIVTVKKTNKYYACRSRSPYSEKNNCVARYTKTPIVDNIFWDMLIGICKNEQSLSDYIGGTMSEPSQENEINLTDKINKQLLKIQNEQSAIMNWFSQSLISQEMATEKLNSLKKKELDFKNRLEKITNTTTKIDTKKICDMVNNCPNSPTAHRNVILSIIDNVSLIRTDNNYGSNYELDIKIKFK